MDQQQHDNRYRYLNLSRTELDRKWKLHLERESFDQMSAPSGLPGGGAGTAIIQGSVLLTTKFTGSTVTLYINFFGAQKTTINWGDGTTSNEITGTVNIQHTYDKTDDDLITIEVFFKDLEPQSAVGFQVQGYNGEKVTELNFIRLNDISELNEYNEEISQMPRIQESNTLNGITFIGMPQFEFSSGVALPNTVTVINVAGNNIQNFDPTFPLPTALDELNLSDNQIYVFDPTHPLPSSLTVLTLTNNHLQGFNPEELLPASLKILELSSNDIGEFTTTNIPPALDDLYLGYNGMYNFNPGPSDGSYKNLDLRHNGLAGFSPQFPLPSRLETLNLSYNGIYEFAPNPALPNSLKYLYLNNNILNMFDAGVLPNALTVLNLKYNQLTNFGNEQGGTPLPSTLNALDLSYNQLTEFNPINSSLPNLSTLTLNNNQLTSFDPLMAMPNIYDLNLSFNQLTSFDPSITLGSNLRFIDLSNNLLTSFNPAQPLPSNLSQLDLHSNQLTSFTPSSLPSSLKTYFLYFNKLNVSAVNDALVCIDAATVGGGGFTPKIVALFYQQPPAAPTGAGLTAKTNLQAKGYVVYTD